MNQEVSPSQDVLQVSTPILYEHYIDENRGADDREEDLDNMKWIPEYITSADLKQLSAEESIKASQNKLRTDATISASSINLKVSYPVAIQEKDMDDIRTSSTTQAKRRDKRKLSDMKTTELSHEEEAAMIAPPRKITKSVKPVGEDDDSEVAYENTTVTIANSKKAQEVTSIGLGIGSIRQTNTPDDVSERGVNKIETFATNERVTTTSQPNKKRRFAREEQEIKWQTSMQEIRKFYKTHGHCRADEHIAALNNLRFDWNLKNKAWEMRLQELREFHRTYGHCRVPSKYPQNPSLGNWVQSMRQEFKKQKEGQNSSLTDERITALSNLGFDWVVLQVTWEKRLEELRKFHQTYGHCRVPWKYPQNQSLGNWVQSMRQEFKKQKGGQQSSLTNERIALLKNLGFDWVVARESTSEKRLQELREFHQTYGHCRVPTKYPQNPSLGRWVLNMRKEFRKRKGGQKSSLTDGRIATLNNLGFDWVVVKESTWEKRLEELRKFHHTYGHCRVPTKYPQNPSLGNWVQTMRQEFRKRKGGQKSFLTDARTAALNTLGFDWIVVKESSWEKRLEELREFHQTYGHCRVPSKYAQNPSLGYWVQTIRLEFRKQKGGQLSSLTDERIAALNNLGFDWAVLKEAWNKRLEELREFHQTYGHCRVPNKYAQNPSLGCWVNTMRQEFKKLNEGQQSSLTDARIAALNNLGFDRIVSEEAWGKRLEELREFRQTYGHCRVPTKYPQNQSLGNWVQSMRQEFKKQKGGQQSSLTDERIAVLKHLGFDWVVVKESSWEKRLQELREFHQAYGHCRVPRKFAQKPSLGNWVQTMRQELRKQKRGQKSSLTDGRIAALNALGFDWVGLQVTWEKRFEELREFHQTYGHCRVPQGYPQNPSLGNWVLNMRQKYRKRKGGQQSTLTDERIAALNNIGFDWVVLDEAWKKRLEELREFHETHSHCRVPQKYPQNPSLGQWVSRMRYEFKKRKGEQQSSLTGRHIDVLSKLGFERSGNDEALEIRLDGFREFHQTNSQCRVPSNSLQNPSLGHLVANTRVESKKRNEGQQSTLTDELIAALDNLGFDWVLEKQSAWEIRLGELRDFHQANGHCRVPSKYSKNPSLGHWVANVRNEYVKRKDGQQSSLTVERIAALDDLGFDCVLVDGARDRGLEALREFHQTYGHCNVPEGYAQNASLGKWV